MAEINADVQNQNAEIEEKKSELNNFLNIENISDRVRASIEAIMNRLRAKQEELEQSVAMATDIADVVDIPKGEEEDEGGKEGSNLGEDRHYEAPEEKDVESPEFNEEEEEGEGGTTFDIIQDGEFVDEEDQIRGNDEEGAEEDPNGSAPTSPAGEGAEDLNPEQQRVQQYILEQKQVMVENQGVIDAAIESEEEGSENIATLTATSEECATIIGELDRLAGVAATSEDPTVQEAEAKELVTGFLTKTGESPVLNVDPATGKLINNAIDAIGNSQVQQKLDPWLQEVTGWEPKTLAQFNYTFTFPFPIPGVSGGISFKGDISTSWDFGSARPDYNGPLEQLGVKIYATLAGTISATGYIDAGFQAGPWKMFTVGAGVYGSLSVGGGPYATLTMDTATFTQLTGKLGVAGDLSFEGGLALVLGCSLLPSNLLNEAVEYFADNWFSGFTEAYQNELRFPLYKEQIAILSLGEIGLTLDFDAGFSVGAANAAPYASIHPNLQAKIDGWVSTIKNGVEEALNVLNQAWNVVVDFAEDVGEAIVDGAEVVGEAAEDAVEWVGDTAEDAVDWVGDTAEDAWDAGTDAVDAVGDFLGWW